MATSFARAEARLGRSTRARLSNAQISVAGGPPVDGVFSDGAALAALGQGVSMQAREFQFIGASAELGAVAPRAPVVVIRPSGTLNLSVAEATANPALGETILGLQRR